MPAARLTVYGATGYTGRLCAAEAVAAGLPLRLAGRRRDALEALAADLGTGAPVAVADASDPAALEAVAAGGGVLLNTVGPFERLGRPVVEAALSGGCDYVDISGEVSFLAWVYGQDRRAADAGVTLCPGAGVDGLAGDLLAAVAAGRLAPSTPSAPAAVDDARVGYLLRGGAFSAGSLRSALSVAASGGAAWVEGRLVAEPAFARGWTVPFPEPLGPRRARSVPLPECLTLARSVRARTARAYAVVPCAPALGGLAAPLAALAGLGARAGVWRALERVVERLPEGPAPARRARARAAVLAEVRAGQATGRAWLRLRDLYASTARLSVGLAGHLLDGGAPRSGTLTPAETLGAAAAGLLDGAGVDWAPVDDR